jgi:hypothetical protein
VRKTLPIVFMLLLSGCATMSPKSTTPDGLAKFLSSDDKQAFNLKMNTTKDGVPTVWRSKAGDTGFELTATHTHVNEQGLPCRNYVLIVNPDYQRKHVTTAIACRENGDWISSGMQEDDGN